MPAGFNLRLIIWRMSTNADDVVGGAVPTGTPYYTNVLGRMTALPPAESFTIPGIETDKVLFVRVVPGTLVIRENDQMEITYPTVHPFYGQRFRILGVTPSSAHPQCGQASIRLEVSRFSQVGHV